MNVNVVGESHESNNSNNVILTNNLDNGNPLSSSNTCKRSNYLSWNEYFMGVAFLAAKRSKDPCSQVGACIVNNDKKIVGIGYNGMPKGCDDDDFSWKKKSENKNDNKHLYVCHAEMNAILNKNASDVRNCTIYVALFPCNECAKIIIQSGIKEVVYMSDKHAHKTETKAAKRMFDASKVIYSKFEPKQNKIEIDFTDIESLTQFPETPVKKQRLSN